MYVARRESIKKNNKLSKVDWGITMSSTKNDLYLEKRILKKKQPFHYLYSQTYKFDLSYKNSEFYIDFNLKNIFLPS